MTPKLSIIVTTWNNEAFIERCLNSILTQKVDYPIEILVGNDASTDSTPEIVERIAAANSEVFRIFHRKPNLGTSENFIDLVFENTILLEKALEKEDVVIIKKIVHKLRPNIKLMGIISLNRNLKEILEFDLNSAITPKFKSNTQKIIHILRATSESLKSSNLI